MSFNIVLILPIYPHNEQTLELKNNVFSKFKDKKCCSHLLLSNIISISVELNHPLDLFEPTSGDYIYHLPNLLRFPPPIVYVFPEPV